jgi:uncharacterized phage protein (TIGR01671 family)
MQREIRFRAWDKDKKEMLIFEDGNGLSLTMFSDGSRVLEKMFGTGKGFVEKYEVMQFTGLKDKNGSEIYEGDIVRNDNAHPSPEVYPVVFEQGMFCIQDYTTPLWKFAPSKFWEVIGNLHESPELLTEPKRT